MNYVGGDQQVDQPLHYQGLLNVVMVRMIAGMEGQLTSALSINDLQPC